MPRSMAFTVLRRLARDVAASDPACRTISRRHFIGSAAAALPAAAVLGAIPVAAAAPRQRVAIIGAGISGLVAALALHDAGYTTQVFEAAGRWGGRVHTNRAGWFGDQVAEWCGELIDTSHVTMLALAKRFGLPLTDVLAATPRDAQYTLVFNGRYYPIAEAARDFIPVYANLRAQLRAAGSLTPYDRLSPEQRRIDAMSVYAWIGRYVPGGHGSRMGKYLERAYLAEFGRDTRELSAINLLYMLGAQSGPVVGEDGFHILGDSDERYHIGGGNDRLTDAIARVLPPGTIALNTRLEAIARNPGGAVALTLRTDGGRDVRHFDRVILTLPFPSLRRVNYASAGFSARKKHAIEQLGYARHSKMHVPFNRRVWRGHGPWPATSDGTIYTDLGFQNTWDTTRGQPGTPGILVAYLGGGEAVAAAADAPYTTTLESAKTRQSIATFLAQLDRVFPGIAAHYGGQATMGSAFLDPLTGGSYSVWLVGQLTAFGGVEGRAEGPIHFAGEHTSLDSQGFMEGGAMTGLRAAHEVLHALRAQKTA